MTSIALYSLASVFLVSIISLVGIFAISINESALRKWILVLVSLAVGALFGDAIIHLIPEAFEESTSTMLTSLLIVGGILAFFALEKLFWSKGLRLKPQTPYSPELLKQRSRLRKPK